MVVTYRKASQLSRDENAIDIPHAYPSCSRLSFLLWKKISKIKGNVLTGFLHSPNTHTCSNCSVRTVPPVKEKKKKIHFGFNPEKKRKEKEI